MWDIRKGFNLGSEPNIKAYHVEQIVPDNEFSEEMVRTKLLPNGWISKRAEVEPVIAAAIIEPVASVDLSPVVINQRFKKR